MSPAMPGQHDSVNMHESCSMTHISIRLFRALLFSFLVCGALAYVLIILYDSQEIDDSIKDHVETEFVSDGNVSETHKPTKTEIPPPFLATG